MITRREINGGGRYSSGGRVGTASPIKTRPTASLRITGERRGRILIKKEKSQKRRNQGL